MDHFGIAAGIAVPLGVACALAGAHAAVRLVPRWRRAPSAERVLPYARDVGSEATHALMGAAMGVMFLAPAALSVITWRWLLAGLVAAGAGYLLVALTSRRQPSVLAAAGFHLFMALAMAYAMWSGRAHASTAAAPTAGHLHMAEGVSLAQLPPGDGIALPALAWILCAAFILDAVGTTVVALRADGAITAERVDVLSHLVMDLGMVGMLTTALSS